jgi:regulator of CtrA degradation
MPLMQAARSSTTPRLIDSLYTEAMLLADEARAYFDRNGREERLALDPLLRVGCSVESLKVTTRLMHVIAWLLTQRAIEAGELSRSGATGEERRLGRAPVSDSALIDRLPEGAAQLVRASQDLFARVARLDGGDAADRALSSPVRSLIGRLERAF